MLPPIKLNFYVCMMQGARVWVREKEQLLPATVNSCGDGILVITTDYGEVRNVDNIWIMLCLQQTEYSYI